MESPGGLAGGFCHYYNIESGFGIWYSESRRSEI